MTDTARIQEILADCCTEYRNGPEMVQREGEGVKITEFFAMPPRPTEELAGRALVDCHFLTVGVDIEKADRYRAELAGLLNPESQTLARGPSYMHLGAWLGGQGAAFNLMALGEVMGFWRIMTPERLGLTGEAADEAAGRGYVMISGYQPNGSESSPWAAPDTDGDENEERAPNKRELELQDIASSEQYTAAMNWLFSLNDAEPGNFLNTDGDIARGLDAAALMSATLIHSFGRDIGTDLAVGNWLIQRIAFHMGVLRELRNNIEAQEPKARGGIYQKQTPHVEVICPHCQTALDGQASIGQDAEIGDGDISFCIRCGEVSVFSSEVPGKLRKPHDGMERTMIEENEAVRAAIQSWRDTVGKDKDRGSLLH